MKKLIFGPFIAAARRAVRLIDVVLNPCPPAPSPTFDFPRPYSFKQTLFLS